LVIQSPAPGIKVVGFACSDLRPQLDARGEIDECDLCAELEERVLAGMAAGGGVVLNLGRVEWFTSAFLHLLLYLRHRIRDRQGRLVLCNLRSQQQAILNLTQTRQLFHIASDEEEASFCPFLVSQNDPSPVYSAKQEETEQEVR
jgi:anti-anti-sigma factor